MRAYAVAPAFDAAYGDRGAASDRGSSYEPASTTRLDPVVSAPKSTFTAATRFPASVGGTLGSRRPLTWLPGETPPRASPR